MQFSGSMDIFLSFCKASAQSLIQPQLYHYTTTPYRCTPYTDIWSQAPPPLKDRGCSRRTTGEYVKGTGSQHAQHPSYLSGCRGRSHYEDTTYPFVPLSRRHRFNRMRVCGPVSLSHASTGWYSGLIIIAHEVRPQWVSHRCFHESIQVKGKDKGNKFPDCFLGLDLPFRVGFNSPT